MSTYGVSPKQAERECFIDPFNSHEVVNYFYQVYQKFAILNTFSAMPSDTELAPALASSVLLEDMFVSPVVSPDSITPEQVSQAEEGLTASLKVTNMVAFLAQKQWAFILADPGMGKSSLLHWMMLVLTSSAKSQIKEQHGSLIPFLITLRELDVNQNINTWLTLWAEVRRVNASLLQPLSESLCESLFKHGQAIFLIDGLDEVRDQKERKLLGEALLDGMGKYPRCKFIMTSRMIGFSRNDWFEAGRLDENLPSVDYLVPFHSRIQKLFLRNWFNAYNPHLKNDSISADTLMLQIKRHKGLRELARTPFLLNIICFIFSRSGTLPNALVELYERIEYAYLSDLEPSSRAMTFCVQELSIDHHDIREMLSALAYNMQEKGDYLAKKVDVVNIFSNYIKTYVLESRKKDVKREVYLILDYIAQRSGLFTPRYTNNGKEHYAFSHASFQEYFAARHIAANIHTWNGETELKSLRKHFRLPAWREVFMALFNLLTNYRDTEAIIEKLQLKEEGIDSVLGRSFSEIIMSRGIRFTARKRNEYIEKLWCALLKGSMSSYSKDAYEWNEAERQWLTILWDDKFNSLDVFKRSAGDMKLKSITITGHAIFDMKALKGLEGSLEELNLTGTRIRDFTVLASLKKLKRLNLCNTPIEALDNVWALDALEEINIEGTRVSRGGLVLPDGWRRERYKLLRTR